MNSIHIQSKILFDDGTKYYYSDKAGIVSSLFSYIMEMEISDVDRKFKNFSFFDFDFEYNNESIVNDLITKLMKSMNFKNGLTLDSSPSPLCIFVENDLIRIDGVNIISKNY